MRGEALTILLVEDNEDHAELVKRNFQHNCVANTIYHVKDGEEALDYLFRRGRYSDPRSSPKPHLVFLDLRLPKVDGIEVLREIKNSEALKTTPVVILTSSESDKDILKAYSSNANSYVVKPVDFQKFTQLMKDLGFYWLGWNENPL